MMRSDVRNQLVVYKSETVSAFPHGSKRNRSDEAKLTLVLTEAELTLLQKIHSMVLHIMV